MIDIPKMKFAFKGLNAGEWTLVVDVRPRARRTGIVIPHIYIEPVDVSGDTISNVAGANYSVLEEKGIRIGSRVQVVKANEIIPSIVEVDNDSVKTTPVIVPTECPSCSSVLEKGNRMLRCVNPNCPEKLTGQTMKFILSIGVDKIGDKRLRLLCQSKEEEEESSITIEELYSLSIEDMRRVKGIAGKTADSFHSQLRDKLKGISSASLLEAIAPPTIGKVIADHITSHMTIEDIFLGDVAPSVCTVASVPGVGNERAKQLMGYRQRGMDLIKFLMGHGLTWIPNPLLQTARGTNNTDTTPLPDGATAASSTTTSSSKAEVVCFTGRGQFSRTEYVGLMRSKRPLWKAASAISKKVTLLVGDENEGSEKIKQAKSNGIPILTYDQFDRMIGL